MAKHQWEKHTSCDRDNCPVCDGGLSICAICGLAEGCLTTDCPGVKCKDRSEQVYAGEVDYRDGQGWVEDASPHSQGLFEDVTSHSPRGMRRAPGQEAMPDDR